MVNWMHANPLSTTSGFRGNGTATEASGPIVCRWEDDPGEDCPRIAGKSPERESLVRAMGAGWQWRTARRGASGSETEVGTGTTATGRGRTAKGSKGPWV